MGGVNAGCLVLSSSSLQGPSGKRETESGELSSHYRSIRNTSSISDLSEIVSYGFEEIEE